MARRLLLGGLLGAILGAAIGLGHAFAFRTPMTPTMSMLVAIAVGIVVVPLVRKAPWRHASALETILRVVLGAVTLHALFAVILLIATMLGADSFAVLVTLLFLSFAFLGLVIPSSMILALENHGPIAGIASALGGTLHVEVHIDDKSFLVA